jgi:hypothetical protein
VEHKSQQNRKSKFYTGWLEEFIDTRATTQTPCQVSLAPCCITKCDDSRTATDDSVEEGLEPVVRNATKDVAGSTCD